MNRFIVWFRFQKYKTLRKYHKYLLRQTEKQGYVTLDEYLQKHFAPKLIAWVVIIVLLSVLFIMTT